MKITLITGRLNNRHVADVAIIILLLPLDGLTSLLTATDKTYFARLVAWGASRRQQCPTIAICTP
jgi:hypothetical protein